MGACLLLLPVTLMPVEGGGLSGSADYAMAAFATAAAIAAGHWLAAPRIRSSVLAGFMLGAAFLTKQEGLIWAAAFAAALAGTMVLRRSWIGWRSLGTAGWAVGIAMICILSSVFSLRGIPNSPYVRPFAAALHWDWFIHTWTRTGFIVRYAVQKLASVPVFGFVWPFVAVVLLALRRSQAAPAILFSAHHRDSGSGSLLDSLHNLAAAFGISIENGILSTGNPCVAAIPAGGCRAVGRRRLKSSTGMDTGQEKRKSDDSEIRLSTISRPHFGIHPEVPATLTPQGTEI